MGTRDFAARSLFGALALSLLSGCTTADEVRAWLTLRAKPSNVTTAPLTLSPPTDLKLIAGESVAFTFGGGVAPYVWTDGGLGYFDGSGRLNVPLAAAAGTVAVGLRDGAGTSFTRNVTIQNFAAKTQTASTITGPSSINTADIIEAGAYLFTIGFSLPYTSDPAFSKSAFVAVHRSSDGGATWSLASTLQPIAGLSANAGGFVASGANLYIVGTSGSQTAFANTFISMSTDQGLTWTTKLTVSAESTYSSIGIGGAVIAADGSLVYAQRSSQPDSPFGNKIVMRRCNVTTWVCVDTDTLVGVGSFTSYVQDVLKDGNGNIYVASLIGSGMFTRDVIIKKSSDNGASWNILRQDANGSFYLYAFAVSNDGQSLMYGGSLSVTPPFAKESTDGGVTWTSITGSCPGWYTTSIVYTATKDAMSGCIDASGPYRSYIARKAFGATAWTTVWNASSDSQAALFTRSNGDIISQTSTTGLRKTSNLGATWTTLGNPAMPALAGDSELTGLAQTSSALYASGYVTTAARVRRGVVKTSLDGGASWTTDLTHATGSYSRFFGIAKSPTTQSLVALGLEGGNNWLVYRYNPIALTWALAESFVNGSASSAAPNSVVSTSNGRYYAVGSYQATSNGKLHSYVRSSVNDGVTWSAFDDYIYAVGFDTAALGATVDGAELYLAGYGVDASSVSHWLVRKWDGLAWSIVDDDTFNAGATLAKARSVLKASDGTLYAAGEYKDASLVRHWVTKRKTASGPWTVVDDFNLANGSDAAALSMIDDTSGRIYVSGMAVDASGVQQAVTRVFSNGAWSTVQRYANFSGGSTASVVRCYVDRVCLVGSSADGGGQLRGFLHVLSP